ncbi:MAG: NusG domain II-containing protein [Veillonellales bacterium]
MKKYSTVVIAGIVIAVAILGFAGLKFFQAHNNSDHMRAVIKQDDKIVERIDLDSVVEPRRIDISSGTHHNIIRVEKGRIRFETADCPDQICVNTGWLTNKGNLAVCMPNKVLIYIEND